MNDKRIYSILAMAGVTPFVACAILPLIGIDSIELLGPLPEVAAGYDVGVRRIEHSGKKRALETAEIFCELLKPKLGVAQRDGLAPKDDVMPLARTLEPDSNLMLVGHLPFMERLVGQLVVGDPERRVFKFQGGGIVCLDRDEAGWHIRWTLMPRIG